MASKIKVMIWKTITTMMNNTNDTGNNNQYWVAQSQDGDSYVVCKNSLWIAIAKFPPLLPYFLFLSDPIIPCPVNDW